MHSVSFETGIISEINYFETLYSIFMFSVKLNALSFYESPDSQSKFYNFPIEDNLRVPGKQGLGMF